MFLYLSQPKFYKLLLENKFVSSVLKYVYNKINLTFWLVTKGLTLIKLAQCSHFDFQDVI